MNKTIYLAGGCFWGMEHLMQKIEGVIDATSGYANGTCEADATYKVVCTGATNFKETVRVIYDDSKVCLEQLLLIYFYVIHPEQRNRQANDIGTQYQTGIYYIDQETKEIVERIYRLEKSFHKEFFVEKGPLINFFEAEEYHQDYLVKNPNGYCHIPLNMIEVISKVKIKPSDYNRKAQDIINDLLVK